MKSRAHLLPLLLSLLLTAPLTRATAAISDNYDAAPLTTGSSLFEPFTPTGFTTQPGEPTHSITHPFSHLSGWWQWRAPASGLLVIELSATNQSYALCTAVYSSPGTWLRHGRANSVPGGDPLNSNYRVARLTLPVIKDRLYYIAAAASSVAPPPTAASSLMRWDFIPAAAHDFTCVFDGGENLSKGIIRVSTTRTGGWTGHIDISGRRHPMRGTIGVGGRARAVVTLRSQPGTLPVAPVVVDLDFRSMETSLSITATLALPAGGDTLTLPRARRYSSADPCPWQGRYAVHSANNTLPRADWPAVLDIKPNGACRMVTYLADRTIITSSTQIAPATADLASLNLYQSRFGGRGSWTAQLSLATPQSPLLVSGLMTARRPAQPGTGLPAAGYDANGSVKGELYFPPAATEWVHTSFGASGGDGLFFFIASPAPPPPGLVPFDQVATLQLNGSFLFLAPNTPGLRATFDRKTGMITGSYRSSLHPGKLVPIRLIFTSDMPGGGAGFTGYLAEPHTYGRVTLTPST